MTLRKGGIGNVLALMAIVGIIVAALVLMLNTLTQQQRIGQITTQSVQKQVTTFELRQRLSACVANGLYNGVSAIGLRLSDATTFCQYAQGVQLTLNIGGNVYTIFVPSDVIKAQGSVAMGDYYVKVAYDACTNGMKSVALQTIFGKFQYQLPAAVVFEVTDKNGNVIDAKIMSAQILVKNIGWIPAPNCFQQLIVPVGYIGTAIPTGFNAINNTYIVNVYSLQAISSTELKSTLCPEGELYLLEPYWNGTRNDVPVSVLVSNYDVGFNATNAIFYELLQLPSNPDYYYLVKQLPWSVTIVNNTARVFTTMLDSPVPLAKGSGAKVLVAMCLPKSAQTQLKPVDLPLNFKCFTPIDKELQLDICYAGPTTEYLAKATRLNLTSNKAETIELEGLQYPVDSTYNRTLLLKEVETLKQIGIPSTVNPSTTKVKIPENVKENNILIIRYGNEEKTVDLSKDRNVLLTLSGEDYGNVEIIAKDPDALTVAYIRVVIQGATVDNIEILKNTKYFKGSIQLIVQSSTINGNVEILRNSRVAIQGERAKYLVYVLFQGGTLKGNLAVLENPPSVAGNVHVEAQGTEISGNVDVMRNTKVFEGYYKVFLQGATTKGNVNVLTNARTVKGYAQEVEIQGGSVHGNVIIMKNVDYYQSGDFSVFMQGATIYGNVEVLTNAKQVNVGSYRVKVHHHGIEVKCFGCLSVEIHGGTIKGNLNVMKNTRMQCGATKVVLFAATIEGNVEILTNAHICGYANVETDSSIIKGSVDVFKNACLGPEGLAVINGVIPNLKQCTGTCECETPVQIPVAKTRVTLIPPKDGVLVYVAKRSYLDPRLFECCAWRTATEVTADIMGVETTLYPGKYGELINDTRFDQPYNATLPNAIFVAPIWQNEYTWTMKQMDTNKIGLVYTGFWRLYNISSVALTAIDQYGDVITTYLAVPNITQYFVGLSNGTTVVPIIYNMLEVKDASELNGLTIIMVNKAHFYVTMKQVT